MFMFSHLVDGFGPRHSRQTHIVLRLPPQNIELLPVDFHLKGVVFDLSGGLGFANLVSKAPLLLLLPHLVPKYQPQYIQLFKLLITKKKEPKYTLKTCFFYFSLLVLPLSILFFYSYVFEQKNSFKTVKM